MKSVQRSSMLAGLLLMIVSAATAQNDLTQFVTRSGDKLMEGGKEYRFVSVNIPNLHLVEDNMQFEATNEWRFPDEFEITDALQSVKQLGGRVVRMYVISICRKTGPNPIPCHVTQPGAFNEEAFRALDKVLQVANRVGVRVIIPLVDHWKWWGGAEQYAEWRGKASESFWTDPEVIADFKKTIDYIVNRRNTLTGTRYKDDKAILAWETGNEIYPPYSWTKQIAGFIKSLDSNHLVWDGFYLGNREIQLEALDDPNIDIVSSHHYPSANRTVSAMIDDIKRFRRQTAGKKVYVVGEIGFIPAAELARVLDVVIGEDLSGALIWSLRFHNRDGGFYWHSEPAGAGLYKAYHYPGFKAGDVYDESAVMKLIRVKAFEIRGLPMPQTERPRPPQLLPIDSVAAITWQGSAGASSYDVERATKSNGPWVTVGKNIDDTWAQYTPLFSDTTAASGATYYYRVRARNAAGDSGPSNVVGPVSVAEQIIVDELSDFSNVFAHEGKLTIQTTDARPYKEDAHRMRGEARSWMTYRTTAPFRSATIRSFMEAAEADLEFYLSADGAKFARVDPQISRFPTEVNPYGYKLPLKYEISDASSSNRFLKIVFKGTAQISRVELHYGR